MHFTKIEDNHFSFEEYKEQVEKIRLVNRIEHGYYPLIIAVLNKVLTNTEIQVVDVSTTPHARTTIHHKEDYSGCEGPPDLLLAKNYEYENRNGKPQYLALVEIKRPFIIWENDIDQLKSHLSVNNKVIFTNIVQWCFFKGNGDIKPEKIIDLQNEVIYSTRSESLEQIQWKAESAKTPDFLLKEMDFPDIHEIEPNVWKELHEYLKKFILE